MLHLLAFLFCFGSIDTVSGASYVNAGNVHADDLKLLVTYYGVADVAACQDLCTQETVMTCFSANYYATGGQCDLGSDVPNNRDPFVSATYIGREDVGLGKTCVTWTECAAVNAQCINSDCECQNGFQKYDEQCVIDWCGGKCTDSKVACNMVGARNLCVCTNDDGFGPDFCSQCFEHTTGVIPGTLSPVYVNIELERCMKECEKKPTTCAAVMYDDGPKTCSFATTAQLGNKIGGALDIYERDACVLTTTTKAPTKAPTTVKVTQAPVITTQASSSILGSSLTTAQVLNIVAAVLGTLLFLALSVIVALCCRRGCCRTGTRNTVDDNRHYQKYSESSNDRYRSEKPQPQPQPQPQQRYVQEQPPTYYTTQPQPQPEVATAQGLPWPYDKPYMAVYDVTG